MRALGYSWHPQTVGEVEKGNRRLTAEETLALAFVLVTSTGALLDPGPDDEVIELPSGQEISAETVRASIRFQNDRSVWWDDDGTPQFLADPASIARQQSRFTGSPQDAQGRRVIPNQPRTQPQEQPVVAAIVTSPLGVLVGRRNDGKPPWTFIAGEVEPGELPEDAAVREVKEETGLEVRAGELIGERVHPKTGRTMIYMAASPTHGTDVFVGDSDELAEVRWVSLAEADELLPGMFEPVREHLARELGAGSGS